MRRLREFRDDERGTTLLELVVGMLLLGIFMSMFTGAMLMMSNTTNNVQAATSSAAQVNSAFLWLDRKVRYATGISTPVQSGASNDWNVEFSTIIANSTTTTGCTQLRVDAGQLQWRGWVVQSNGTSYSGLTSWLPLASFLSNGTAAPGATTQPFSLPPASKAASTSFQQLTITVVAGSGSSTAATSTMSMTFTALNSSANSTTVPCQQVAVDATS